MRLFNKIMDKPMAIYDVVKVLFLDSEQRVYIQYHLVVLLLLMLVILKLYVINLLLVCVVFLFCIHTYIHYICVNNTILDAHKRRKDTILSTPAATTTNFTPITTHTNAIASAITTYTMDVSGSYDVKI